MSKILFITGTSKGFGRIWAEAALEQGHQVVATARDINTLTELTSRYGAAVLPLALDVTNREACTAAVNQAHAHFGRLDVLISNAGYGQFGYIEEISEDEARQQLETNVFGSLWCIQAVLPIMRAQQQGHIIQVSSIGGILTFPGLGIYHASKWAMEGLCDSLSQEVTPFNIHVTLVEPGGYSTDWGTTSAAHSQPNPAYAPQREAMQKQWANSAAYLGKPEATAEAILQLLVAETPPLRLLLGAMPLRLIEPAYQQRLTTWKEWQPVAEKAQG
ncbi:SDR family oxidoreductase [Hymenobacter negativus]|uniref:SDR family oxidoreductase n=1 Tax=Hymenobacter negativus TaxID=2795026 RepID=A0ABS3QK23_9BACT|nr:SDR family oxidoreductase [Hymenobacter negativus]MBO2011594.1 SDR family oxidoreductase [Hymenobacter negativus]